MGVNVAIVDPLRLPTVSQAGTILRIPVSTNSDTTPWVLETAPLPP
jgi:hypothetical protein